MSNGADDTGNRQGFKLPFHRHRTAAAAFIGLAQFHHLELDLLDPAIFPDNLRGVGQEFIDHALFPGLVNFQLFRRHLRLCPAVDHIDLLRPQADRSPAGIHGGVAAAHHSHLVANGGLLPHGYLAQEVNASHHAVQLFPRTADGHTLPRANGQNHRVIAVLKFLKGHIPADAEIVLHLHTQGGNLRNLLVQHPFGQPVFRDSVPKHSAHLGHRVHNGHPVPF